MAQQTFLSNASKRKAKVPEKVTISMFLSMQMTPTRRPRKLLSSGQEPISLFELPVKSCDAHSPKFQFLIQMPSVAKSQKFQPKWTDSTDTLSTPLTVPQLSVHRMAFTKYETQRL